METRRLFLPACVLLFGGWLLLALTEAWQKSFTNDELPHLASGLAVLEYGDFRINPEHPPLVKVLAALPLWLLAKPDLTGDLFREVVDARVPFYYSLSDQVPWGYYIFFMARGESPQIPLFLGRLVPVAIGLLGGWLALWWGRHLSRSPWGGLLSALFVLYYPEYMGHAAYVTLDVPTLVATGALSTAAVFWWRRPGWVAGAVWVVTACLATLVKLPVSIACAVTGFALLTLALAHRRIRVATLILGVVTLLAIYTTQWAAAGFRFKHARPTPELIQASPYIPTGVLPPDAEPTQRLVNFCWRHRLLPESTLATLNHAGGFGKSYFLFGESRGRGWLSYFGWTTIYKSPLAWLAGAVVLGGVSLWRRVRRGGRIGGARRDHLVLLLAAPVVLLAAVVMSRHNLGHRYILFMVFPVGILVGTECWRWIRRPDWRRWFAGAVLAGSLVPALTSWPNGATYFNVLAGPPEEAQRILRDSNLDWGQDVAALALWYSREELTDINLALDGHNRPGPYGISPYRWVDPAGGPLFYAPLQPLDSSLYTAVSANRLEGMRKLYPEALSGAPVHRINSILIYPPLTPAR
ncbi:hypothetical protein GC173_07825 [bacterium]|nr:hypothetical protein [bacterium]